LASRFLAGSGGPAALEPLPAAFEGYSTTGGWAAPGGFGYDEDRSRGVEMKELRDIIQRLSGDRGDGAHAIATVIEVRGSAFRRPGARMLIAAGGRLVGSVSGGCLEADVCKRAEAIIASGVPEVLTYDTTSDADIVWGLGLGCNGIVRILVEPVAAGARPPYLDFVRERLDRGEPATIATVTGVSPNPAAAAGGLGSAPRVGARVLLHQDGTIASADVTDPAWLARVLDTTRRALDDRDSRVISSTDPATGIELELYCETIKPPVPLVIFGSGDDAAMVGRLAKTLGWHVTIVDRRPSYLTRERLPEADVLTLCEPDAIVEHVPLSPRTAALVMTHNYLQDFAILEILLPRGLAYIGQLGPRRRTDRLLQELAAAHGTASYGETRGLHAPVGLDLGAETPEEIALAIVAEIQAVTTQREAGFLRNRPGPIHLASPAPAARA
jgi:xanthine/CO dehydrogenase XdhC/CoxF family maturation factor